MRHVLLICLLCSVAHGTTYYVRATGGDDGNDGQSFAAGWATLQKAFDTVNAGDILHVCATGASPFTLSATVDVDMNGGANTTATADNPITIKGADLTTGAAYAGSGQAKITTGSTLAGGLLAVAAAAKYLVWYDLLLDGGGSGKASYCIEAAAAGEGDGHRFYRCRFTNSSAWGVSMRGAPSPLWYRCEFDNNGKGGASYGIYTRNDHIFIGCVIHDNTGDGVYAQDGLHAFGCLVYDNTDDGWVIANDAYAYEWVNCLAYGNDGDGWDATATGGRLHRWINCTAASNGAYGWNLHGIDVDLAAYNIVNCHTDGNGTAATDINSGTLPGIGNITGAPAFVSTTDGSENFALQSSSPLKATGCPGALPAGGTGYMDIGPLQRQEPSGFITVQLKTGGKH